MRPMSLMSSGCSPWTPVSYAACSPVSMICASTSLLRLVDDFLDAARDGCGRRTTSFSSASRATSRRTGSKHETTTVSGVSSMMTSTPVASSNARMFRPSRPMMRPFISSFGRRHGRDRRSRPCARRRCAGWRARRSSCASRSAFRRAVSRISRSRLAASACGLLLEPADQLGLGLLRGHAGQLLEPAASPRRRAARAPARARRPSSPSGRARCARRPTSLSRCSSTSNFRSSVRLALLDAPLFALDFLAPAARLDLPVLAELDQLFLAGDHRALSQRFGFALGFADDALGGLLGRGLRERLRCALCGAASAAAEKEKGCGGDDDQYAKRGTQCRSIHVDLCSTAACTPRR